jgi:dihydrofolate synthase/folylpolyglutamate synthase
MGPLVDRWYFTDLPTARAQTAANLMAAWESRETGKNVLASTWPDPTKAMQAALAAAGPADRIVVFGSFYTVGGVLRDGIPRLHAKHLNA